MLPTAAYACSCEHMQGNLNQPAVELFTLGKQCGIRRLFICPIILPESKEQPLILEGVVVTHCGTLAFDDKQSTGGVGGVVHKRDHWGGRWGMNDRDESSDYEGRGGLWERRG